jgi:hypothetical protein
MKINIFQAWSISRLISVMRIVDDHREGGSRGDMTEGTVYTILVRGAVVRSDNRIVSEASMEDRHGGSRCGQSPAGGLKSR